MRNAFIDELIQLATINEKIILVTGDLGYGVIEPFAEEFPDRFFNAGVAEQNMMGFSAGLASEGFHVFAYSIANFPTFRCAEQIRNDVAYHNLPVTIVSVGGGLSYGNLGYSHHAVQDFALIRTMPNMLIASPGDPMETRACMRYLTKNPQPSYLRLGKTGEESFHKKIPKLKPGRWAHVDNKKTSKVILSTGTALSLAKKISAHKDMKDYCVFTLPLWGIDYKNIQPEQMSKFSSLLTIEDHLVDGGFGSWMLESFLNNKALYSKIDIRGLNSEVCGMVGSQNTLNEAGGLNSEEIINSLVSRQ
jgi:transketolase